MFAIAIYNLETNKLLLSRDRVGIKPLYYYIDEDQIIFASEIKAILTNTIINFDNIKFFGFKKKWIKQRYMKL